jgi:Ca2+-binding EF-hand superfamily protein
MHFDFCPHKAFALIDQRAGKRLDAYDIANFLRSNYIQATLNQCELMVKEYCEGGDLDFNQFCSFVLP